MTGRFPSNDSVPADLLDAMGSHAPQFRLNAAPLLERLRRPTAELVFGGHFSSGKSTLINALLGRHLLPTDDLPETGAPCRLVAGGADHGLCIDADGGERGLACDRDAISRLTSVYDPRGERAAVSALRLELTLRDAPISPRVAWTDAPGTNDAAPMTEKALELAMAADLVLWTLNSRQCLAEPEIPVLAELVARKGTAGIVFVVNAFLPQDTDAAWNAFLQREWPRHLERVRDHLPQMGWGNEAATILPVSARAAHGGRGFGMDALRALLAGIDGPESPIVVRSRRMAVELAVRAHQDALRPQREAAARTLSKAEAAAGRHVVERNNRRAFMAQARSLIAEHLESFTALAGQAGEAVARQVVGPLRRDDTYEQMLNAQLRNLGVEDAVCGDLARALDRHSLRALPASARAAVRECLDIPYVSVTVADTPLDKGMIARRTAAGAGIGAILGPLALLGAGLGTAAGLAAANAEKARQDILLTRQSVERAAAVAAGRLQARHSDILEALEAHLGRLPPPPPAPDPAALRALEALAEGYQGIARMAAGTASRSRAA